MRLPSLKASLLALCAGLVFLAGTASAQEAAIRKNLAERLPNLPKIDEISKTPINGLYEVRVNQSEILYTDEKANFIIQGDLIDVNKRANLTEDRRNKFSAISFDKLPLKDAITTVRGNGKRKLAVFSDPNCGFCKRLERDLSKLENITIYTFLVTFLGPDSQTKAKNIWCAKNKSDAYLDWMLEGTVPPTANCDAAAVTRNTEFAGKHRITGTPTSFLLDGTRVQGADFKQIEQKLAAQP